MTPPFFADHSTSVIAGVFTNSISLGTAVVGIMLVVFGGYFAWKSKALDSAQGNASEANTSAQRWRQEYEALRDLLKDKELQYTDALREEHTRYDEQRALKHAALTENAALRMATDLSGVMKALTDMAVNLIAFSEAQQSQTRVLEQIEKRLAAMNGKT